MSPGGQFLMSLDSQFIEYVDTILGGLPIQFNMTSPDGYAAPPK